MNNSPDVTFIANMTAGGAARYKIDAAIAVMERMERKVNVLSTGKRGDAEAFARKASQEGAALVVAAGGDGTINEVTNGLALGGTALGIIPTGTANVVALELGIPLDPVKAAELSMTGEPHSINLGHVEAEGTGRYFLMCAGIGFDAEVVKGVRPGIKKLVGKGAYVLSTITSLAMWRPKVIKVSTGDRETQCQSLIVTNARLYAGSFVLGNRAGIRNDIMEAVCVKCSGRLDIIRFMGALGLGRHLSLACVEHFGIDYLSSNVRAHIQLDGDYLCEGAFSVRAVPGALRLVC